MTETTQLDRANRWGLGKQGQIVETDPAGNWDLADEIVRLKITDPVGEATIAPLADSSPLETASSITSSPHTPGNQIGVSHSRESSTDVSAPTSRDSSGQPTAEFKADNAVEVKERPHSFSGGLSSADLRRLQQAGGPEVTDHLQQQQQQHWVTTQNLASDDKPPRFDQQPSYPSLANTIQRPQPADYRQPPSATVHSPTRDDLMQQIDYNIQQRFNNAMSPASATGQGNLPFGQRSAAIPSPLYRQPPRAFPQQNVIPSPTALAYPGAHVPSLSLGNSQQLYDMMLPPHETMNPAVNRVQQQHNVFRGAHHHSTSDPSALRDATAMALLNGNLQFSPAMFPAGMAAPPPGMPIYPNQFYRAQDAYRPDAPMATRLPAQYSAPYGMVQPPIDPSMGSPTNSNGGGQNGPSANNRKLGLYKTELCRSWEEKGSCRYGAKCQFAHGEEELRIVSRHPKYKTEICRTFWVSGSCPYGKRCCFIHTELPTSGNVGAGSTTGSESTPPPAHQDGRARSMSTNSDPNDGSVSLLARISAKRSQESSATATPVDSPSSFQFTRPPTGSLRVDTSVDGSLKQNKSAYPTFARNGVMLPAPESIKPKSPGPVTAGPDLGRHNSSRLEIVGYNHRVNAKATTPPSTTPRNSIGNADELNFAPSPVSGPGSGHSYTLSGGDGPSSSAQSRVNGHVRAGSAGNWANIARNNALTSYPSPGGDTINSPWSTTELAVGSSRFTDKAWAS